MRPCNYFGLPRITHGEKREVKQWEASDRGYAKVERKFNGKSRFKRNDGKSAQFIHARSIRAYRRQMA